jgi:hemolysin III
MSIDNRFMDYGERFNGYTHLAGALLALGGASVLIAQAALRADPWRISSFTVYGLTLFLLYVASTLYHGSRGRAKNFFRKLDHCAIYLVIAGTYTPFALVSLTGDASRTLFVGVWSLALLGIAQELWIARGARLTSLAIYLLMGWMALVALEPLIEALTWNGFAWLLGGGLIYTAGIVFYLYDERFRHWHGLWHLCVLAGSAVHYAAILKFVA